ncbi:hypothetical protein TNCV_592481 [Trichonephila clavipes]|nr:hypothetical protein TNCV_592481 [Trichonephila clavipes]
MKEWKPPHPALSRKVPSQYLPKRQKLSSHPEVLEHPPLPFTFRLFVFVICFFPCQEAFAQQTSLSPNDVQDLIVFSTRIVNTPLRCLPIIVEIKFVRRADGNFITSRFGRRKNKLNIRIYVRERLLSRTEKFGNYACAS